MFHQQTVRIGLVSYALVTAFVIAVAATFLYFSHVTSTLADIADLMVKRKDIWLDITNYSERLVSFDETRRMPERIILRVQDQLAALLEADANLHTELNEQIDKLDRFPISRIYDKPITLIRTSDIPLSVRTYLANLARSPVALLGARYSSLELPDAILIKSGKVISPLDQQDEALRSLRKDLFEMRAPVEWAITAILLIAIWASWFGLLRPSLVYMLELQHTISMNEQQAHTTLSSIGEAVIVANAHGRIEMLNPAAEKLIGGPKGCGIGGPLAKVLDRCGNGFGDDHDFPVGDVLTTPRVIKRRIRLPSREAAGNERHIDLTAAPLTLPSGTRSGVVLVLRDITHELKIREQLRNSEKARALSALAGGLAHEFNNTLAVITGANDLLEIKISRMPGADGTMQRYISSIKSAVKHSSALTSQLLAIGRKSGFKLNPMDVAAPLSEVVDILRRTTDRSIEITLNIEADDCHRFTLGDHASLHSAFLNFGLNSINAIVPPGKIVVTIQHIPKEECQTLDDSETDHIRIEWTDTGRGISPENIRKIFEPFYTTRTELGGVGLGLSVAQSIIHEHNGSVTATSKPGIGTTLTVYLPCTPKRPKPTSDLQTAIVTKSGSRVLFAEDEAKTAEFMKEYLTSKGFEVLVARNGREALELYQSHRNQIDIVILDINLPLMPGHEVAQEIQKIDPHCAIIISTGYLEAGVSRSLEANGIDTILKKPYPAQHLLTEIARLQQPADQRDQAHDNPRPTDTQ